MAELNQLVEQHILEHESHLKHIDELMENASKKVAGAGEAAKQLEGMKQKRDQLSSRLEELKLKPPEKWSEEDFERTGPMVVWDALAQELEKLVESMEK